jgi:hypothetical protein
MIKLLIPLTVLNDSPNCKHLVQPPKPLYCVIFKTDSLAGLSNTPEIRKNSMVLFICSFISMPLSRFFNSETIGLKKTSIQGLLFPTHIP